MLTSVDRVQLVVRDRAAAEETFRDLLGAEKVREDESGLLQARRSVVQAGISEFELLEPKGDGPVRAHLERWGEGIFAAGFATADLSALCQRLSARGVEWREEGGQVFIEPEATPGLRMVLTEEAERAPVGLIRWLYEVTNIIDDHQAAAQFYTDTFGLDPARFSPIESHGYGYTGQLLLFDPPARLDRIELSQITDPARAMGRFATKRGQSIYMCYVETDNVDSIIERLKRRGARWAGRSDDPHPEGLFIHPSSLHGVLLGVSRTKLAWQWSGRPELARSATQSS
ncbi:MAG: VOC family protein [Chloroflexi bacterium]|nr:VOC family protein [Chloroflexota bacterium]